MWCLQSRFGNPTAQLRQNGKTVHWVALGRFKPASRAWHSQRLCTGQLSCARGGFFLYCQQTAPQSFYRCKSHVVKCRNSLSVLYIISLGCFTTAQLLNLAVGPALDPLDSFDPFSGQASFSLCIFTLSVRQVWPRHHIKSLIPVCGRCGRGTTSHFRAAGIVIYHIGTGRGHYLAAGVAAAPHYTFVLQASQLLTGTGRGIAQSSEAFRARSEALGSRSGRTQDVLGGACALGAYAFVKRLFLKHFATQEELQNVAHRISI